MAVQANLFSAKGVNGATGSAGRITDGIFAEGQTLQDHFAARRNFLDANAINDNAGIAARRRSIIQQGRLEKLDALLKLGSDATSFI